MIEKEKLKESQKPISFVETPQEIADLMVNLITKKKESIILDTGCGRGQFLKSLMDNGFKNIEAIELNKGFCEYCKLNFNSIQLYNHDYLIWNSPKKYDVIIGNPPYAHFNSLPPKIQQEVLKITKTRESDIYYAFILKSIDLLRERGELIYIVPYGFFYNTHAKIVRRKIIENGDIRVVIDLDETRLFHDEHPETIIFKFLKVNDKFSEKIKILRILNRNAQSHEIYKYALGTLTRNKGNSLFDFHVKPQFTDFNAVWSAFPEIDIPEYMKLNNVAYVGVGLVSGFDLAFRIEQGEEEIFNNREKQLIFNFVKAANCKGFWIEGTVNYILTDEKLTKEAQISENYPNVYKKIVTHKKRMTNRYLPSNKKWFHWQALRNRTTIEKYLKNSKIFVPTLDRSKSNRFSLSNEEVYPSGDVLCIIPLKIDSLFLLGYLNSNFFREYYLSYGARRGHRIAFTQRIMSNIKIPSFTREVILKIKKVTRAILQMKDQSKRVLIDEIIEEAFEKNLFEKTGLLKYL